MRGCGRRFYSHVRHHAAPTMISSRARLERKARVLDPTRQEEQLHRRDDRSRLPHLQRDLGRCYWTNSTLPAGTRQHTRSIRCRHSRKRCHFWTRAVSNILDLLLISLKKRYSCVPSNWYKVLLRRPAPRWLRNTLQFSGESRLLVKVRRSSHF